jgi:LemA protein
MARRYYNGAVRNQNTLVQTFPVNLIAGPFGFAPRAYFEVSSDAERNAPALSL